MPATTCPTRENLAAFQSGRLGGAELDQVAEHLESCAACQTILQAASTMSDAVLRGLKDARESDTFTAESGCRHAVARIERIANKDATQTRDDTSSDGAPGGGPALTSVGQYRLIEQIGQGGMGTVYKATHVLLKRTVAIKMLPPNRLKNANAVNRFRREIEAAGRLKHDNIVHTSDAAEAEGQHFLVMEWLAGQDLSKYVSEHGPRSVGQACDFICQAALGLQCAHEHGMVHRDVKPSNLMLVPEPQPTIKVLDLGLALLHDEPISAESGLTSDGQVVGSYDYIAPEQAME